MHCVYIDDTVEQIKEQEKYYTKTSCFWIAIFIYLFSWAMATFNAQLNTSLTNRCRRNAMLMYFLLLSFGMLTQKMCHESIRIWVILCVYLNPFTVFGFSNPLHDIKLISLLISIFKFQFKSMSNKIWKNLYCLRWHMEMNVKSNFNSAFSILTPPFSCILDSFSSDYFKFQQSCSNFNKFIRFFYAIK